MSEAAESRRKDNVGTGLIVVATLFSALAVLAFQAFGSRTLGPEGFAPIAVLWTLMFLVYTVIHIPGEQHLTRALVVSRNPTRIRRVHRQMGLAFAGGGIVGVVFVVATLDRFFEGEAAYIAITAGIMVSRSIMAAARGTLAGHRRFGGYGATIALEAGALLTGGLIAAIADLPAPAFALMMAIAPLATLLARPFADIEGHGTASDLEVQPGSFLVWLILATAASQLIIAGGPIAVSFVGGTAAAVSIFFTTFALLRGPVTSAYNLVARVLPDFTALAQGPDPAAVWRWAPRITGGAAVLAVLGAAGAGLLLGTIVGAIYGEDFVPPTLAAVLGGAGVGLGLGALFATQIYSATARGAMLASGWAVALAAAIGSLVLVSGLEPIERVALGFVVGEATGLVLLGLVFPTIVMRKRQRLTETRS